jgi:hypothetical protein
MDLLKRLFPLSFISKPKDANALVRSLVLYGAVLVAYFLVSALLGYLLGTLVSWLLGLLGSLLGLYGTGGMVLAVLRYCDIIP